MEIPLRGLVDSSSVVVAPVRACGHACLRRLMCGPVAVCRCNAAGASGEALRDACAKKDTRGLPLRQRGRRSRSRQLAE